MILSLKQLDASWHDRQTKQESPGSEGTAVLCGGGKTLLYSICVSGWASELHGYETD